jgi:adenine/guanine/hypoxanthine permease
MSGLIVSEDARHMELSQSGSFTRWLDSHFSISERGSTFWTEVFAGITTYLSLSFVFILNPAILGATPPDSHGLLMSPKSILIATVCASAGATILMGFWANLPLAVGPGIEVSAFFTYVLVRQMGLSWEEALLAVVVSGILNLTLTIFSIRQKIVEAIPQGLRASLLLSIGVFVFLVGLKLGNVVDVGRHTEFLFLKADFYTRQSFFSGPFILLVGLATSTILNIRRLKLPWGTLIGIIGATVAWHMLGLHANANHALKSAGWTSTMFRAFDVDVLRVMVTKIAFWSGVVIMFVIDFVGGISKIYALAEGTRISRVGDKIPGLKEALFVDGGATIVGGTLGTSSLTAFVESRIGIEAGGQTGLMAVVCGALMLAGGMFSGLLTLVPPQAASGPLIYVGILLIVLNLRLLRMHGLTKKDYGVAAAMSILVLWSFQFDYALFAGFLAYSYREWRRERKAGPVFWLGIVALFTAFTVVPDILHTIGISH